MGQTCNKSWIVIQYMATLFIMVCVIGLCLTDFALFFFLLIWWLFIPALIVAAISFFSSIWCNTDNKKILLILHITNIALIVFWIYNPDSSHNNRVNADVMEEHYEEYGPGMERIYRNLYDELKPGQGVMIEFEHGDVSMFHVMTDGKMWNQTWDPSQHKIDSLLLESGLDRNDLKQLQNDLKDVGCISIKMMAVPDEPYTIGFRREGMGEYSYKIYPKPLTAVEQKKINDSATSLVYTPQVVFEYGGGAFGNQVFIGKEEYLEKKARQRVETDSLPAD